MEMSTRKTNNKNNMYTYMYMHMWYEAIGVGHVAEAPT